jgi:hypothetical protein
MANTETVQSTRDYIKERVESLENAQRQAAIRKRNAQKELDQAEEIMAYTVTAINELVGVDKAHEAEMKELSMTEETVKTTSATFPSEPAKVKPAK